MKLYWYKFEIFILAILLLQLDVFGAESADQSMAASQAACSKNTANEWSSKLNKCVSKQESKETRKEAEACNALKDLAQKEKCNKDLAEKLTGLSSDPNKINQVGGTTKSMIMNGAVAAYALLNYFNILGAKGKSSPCMSKKILGITAVAGLMTDFYLKYNAKKKVKKLSDQYKLDVKMGAQEAQVKALEYLKEEQKTVVSIAGMEQKRNMVLMLGYGAAAAMAIYEMTPMGANAACIKPDPEKETEPGKESGTGIENQESGTTGTTATVESTAPETQIVEGAK